MDMSVIVFSAVKFCHPVLYYSSIFMDISLPEMISAVQFHHPLLCHNAKDTSVVRNVLRSTISSPTSVSKYHEYLYSSETFLH
jgi:hypothetical protein